MVSKYKDGKVKSFKTEHFLHNTPIEVGCGVSNASRQREVPRGVYLMMRTGDDVAFLALVTPEKAREFAEDLHHMADIAEEVNAENEKEIRLASFRRTINEAMDGLEHLANTDDPDFSDLDTIAERPRYLAMRKGVD